MTLPPLLSGQEKRAVFAALFKDFFIFPSTLLRYDF